MNLLTNKVSALLSYFYFYFSFAFYFSKAYFGLSVNNVKTAAVQV